MGIQRDLDLVHGGSKIPVSKMQNGIVQCGIVHTMQCSVV